MSSHAPDAADQLVQRCLLTNTLITYILHIKAEHCIAVRSSAMRARLILSFLGVERKRLVAYNVDVMLEKALFTIS